MIMSGRLQALFQRVLGRKKVREKICTNTVTLPHFTCGYKELANSSKPAIPTSGFASPGSRSGSWPERHFWSLHPFRHCPGALFRLCDLRTLHFNAKQHQQSRTPSGTPACSLASPGSRTRWQRICGKLSGNCQFRACRALLNPETGGPLECRNRWGASEVSLQPRDCLLAFSCILHYIRRPNSFFTFTSYYICG